MSLTRSGQSTRTAAGGGGVAARRAMVRWAWRLYRREWRQQVLVLALLTVAVGATIFSASAAYNLAPVSGNAEFGTASHFRRFDVTDPHALAADVAAAEEWFGTIDVLTHRFVPVPGSVETVEYRGQDPQGAFSGPMLALREGRYPTSAGEVAVTDGVAKTFGLDIGTQFALDGTARTVVGVVENPSDLSAEFALVDPVDSQSPESVTILVGGSSERLESFQTPSGPISMEISSRADNEGAVAVVGVLVVATVALMLVALVAAASFVVLAQRRLRQLGMLAAIGATQKHLRLVLVTNGALVGAVAALLGAFVGSVSWVVVAPFLEPALGHRIDPLNVPWWLIGTGMLLAVVTATGAAWWPARAVARVPITRALSGRPPGPIPVQRSAVLPVLLILVGVVCLVWGDLSRAELFVSDSSGEPLGSFKHLLLIGAGTVATVLGVLLISPLAIRALATAARWSPIAVRLALRDLARYQARSGAALAAISLALGISVTLVVGTAAAEFKEDEGNLADRQLLVWTRDADAPEGVSPYYTTDPNDEGFSPYLPRLTPTELEQLEVEANRIAATLDEPTVTALELAVDPAIEPSPDGRLAVTLAVDHDIGLLDVALLYVATPELLEQYGLELGALDPEFDILTTLESDTLWFPDVRNVATQRFGPEAVTNIERIPAGYASLPAALITPEALRQRGWDTVPVGWLIETNAPLTSEQLAAARDSAADAGLLIETRREQPSLANVRTGATAAGIFVALAVLAMTVGLIRGESAGDLRTLTATGATSTIRRTLTAATAGALALLGVTLGAGGAYISLAALYLHDLGALSPIPVLHLLVLALGVPLAAAGAGWLLAGREPSALARRAIE